MNVTFSVHYKWKGRRTFSSVDDDDDDESSGECEQNDARVINSHQHSSVAGPTASAAARCDHTATALPCSVVLPWLSVRQAFNRSSLEQARHHGRYCHARKWTASRDSIDDLEHLRHPHTRIIIKNGGILANMCGIFPHAKFAKVYSPYMK